jgi:Outer membrane protein beta-barrel domain
MKGVMKSFVTISALSVLAAAPILMSASSASASPKKGTNASYVGAGISAGVTNGGQNGDAATFGGNLTGRAKVGTTPFSVRGQINFSDQNSAIIPHATVDIPVARGTNVYVGAGYQFSERDGKPIPSGNTDGVAVVAGVESEVTKNFLIYSNATVGVRAYKNSPASGVSINSGVGYRFR